MGFGRWSRLSGLATLLTALGCGAAGAPMSPAEAPMSAPPAAMATMADATGAPAPMQRNTESYSAIVENDFLRAAESPLSTFSIDVDTASYSNVRRFLSDGALPPPDAVRIEELVNYFTYDYPNPTGSDPFAVAAETTGCPWNPKHRLLRIGLQGRRMPAADVPPRNLVFLLDVSGSMGEPRKLPLLRNAFKLLTEQLRPQDTVSIVVYAGAGGLVLEPTAGSNRSAILAALERLHAGGSTNGGQGIQLAYAMARKSFKQGGINRVILATDGDFNVGVTREGDLTRMIEREREGGVFLTVLGLGTGNLKDSTMEQLANKGNGNYAYLDSLGEARKVLVQQAGATLVTIAKDVKIQVEFNPKQVQAYRLIGYENRLLRTEDFNDDKKDAGEIGAGHSVTALYEIVPAGAPMTGSDRPAVDPLKYQSTPTATTAAAASGELCFVKIRYKEPQGNESKLLSFPVTDRGEGFANASVDLRFASSVAAFGMLLRDSKHKGSASWTMTRDAAQGALGADAHGYRAEFLTLVGRAEKLRPDPQATVIAK
jgi:Ca-activated chloride channel family protein